MSTTETLRDRIEEVSTTTADGPHLVTFAVPPEESIDDASDRLEAAATPDEESPDRAETALDEMRDLLAEYDETPANGLVAYAGVVDGDPVAHAFDDLSSPVPEPTYERAAEFATDPLEAAVDESTYGLLVVEHGRAELGLLEDGDVEQVATFDSDTARDTPTSGDIGDRGSVDRDFFEAIARRAGVEFLGEDPDEERREEATPGEADARPVEALAVGGSSVTAEEFLEGEYLDHRLQRRVVGDAFAIEDTTTSGLDQLAEKARDDLERAERPDVAAVLDRFLSELETGDEAVAGTDAVDEALAYEGVATTLALETLPAEDRRTLERRTVEQGGEFVPVPTDVDGADRLESEGSVGAILRFPID